MASASVPAYRFSLEFLPRLSLVMACDEEMNVSQTKLVLIMEL